MSATPFYLVKCVETGLVVSDYTDSFRYQESKSKDDLLTLTLSDPSERIIDDPSFVQGNTLDFRFGYRGGAQSANRLATIDDVDVVYDRKVTMTIRAYDAGHTIKNKTSNRIWQDKTASDIVKEIASQFGLKAKVDETKRVFDEIPQANKSYFEFCKFLTKGYDSSVLLEEMNFYIQNDTLYFTRKKLDATPRRTYTRRPASANNELLFFKPQYTKDGKGETDTVKAFTINSETNEVIESSGDLNSKTVLASQETSGRKYDVDANLLDSDTGKNIFIPGDDKEQVGSKVQQKQSEAATKELKAEIKTIGDPYAHPDSIITIKGVAKRHQGNWYVDEVTHVIARGGYYCDQSANKNTTKSAESAASANAEVGIDGDGPNGGAATENIRRYDVNANEL